MNDEVKKYIKEVMDIIAIGELEETLNQLGINFLLDKQEINPFMFGILISSYHHELTPKEFTLELKSIANLQEKK